ncbi:(2Fe-2S)-binding protein [Synechocystis sp. PCC 7339]|uniref:2Fe-2S iron-sulfur cluster-binding protein n=1 Tax=unclassified Synechocystis TaxID=2640012 RepID=UPI001BB0CC7C|nr:MULTISPECIES: 2Fe-2S iron-sulfur cluster-binding protein [unclassified Synechocystis]QUS60373.1 (2Fe-2S)-binding protein [Synechocystis sp. PCC 7338]UAJ72182.1 (2Fe-2S)-binding protein [Synechocystis sp. PCC 7339]
MNNCVISFPESNFLPLSLQFNARLGEYLTPENSPILFGCRTGLCGTCLVKVLGEVPAPEAEERELLAILAPDNAQARLACQIKLTGNIAITTYQSDEI